MWIGDQFGKTRAEQLSLRDIATIFSPTPETSVLERPTNHLILGAKGSGKSTLLRALSWPAWKQRSLTSVNFIGIYVPIRYEDANYFRTSYNDQQNGALFEHFFVVSLLYNACSQLSQCGISDSAVVSTLAEYLARTARRNVRTLDDLALRFLSEREACITEAKSNPVALPSDLRESKCIAPFGITKVNFLADQLVTLLKPLTGNPEIRFGILIDSLDYYDALVTVLAPLFEADSSNPLVVKAAARSLNVADLTSRTRSRRLEVDRDFEIVSLDREADDEDHFLLLRDAICRRARYGADPAVAALADSEILDLLFCGSRRDDDDLASFYSFARLSSGNILQVILLLDESAAIFKQGEKTIPTTLTPLSRAARLAAIEQESRKFWDLEIGVRLPVYKLDAKVYLESLLEVSKSGALPEEQLAAPRFSFGFIPQENQDLVSALLSSRVLLAHNPIVHRTLQAGYPHSGPVLMELNRLLLPTIGLNPFRTCTIEVDVRDFHRRFARNLKETKPHLSPKSSYSRGDLFAPDFTVFISIPFDRAQRTRTQIVRKAINKIYQETTGRQGGEGLSFIDIHFIPHVGSFRFEIPKYISESTYLVADISECGIDPTRTAGVFYEIGLAVGLKKPFALFYNSRDTRQQILPFDPRYLPRLLAGQTVIVVSETVDNFFQKYKPVHEQLIAYNGFLDHPLGVARPAAVPRETPFVYLSFQPRNSHAMNWCIRVIREILPDVHVLRAEDWAPDDAPTFFHALSDAAFCIIDCTGGVNDACIELGAAAALDIRKVVEAFSADIETRVNPVAMFPGKRFAWTDLGENDSRALSETIRNLARTTTLGLRRP